MNTLLFLAAWALRSSILILCGWLLLRVLRVKNPSLCLTAWTAMLCGSLAISVLTMALPQIPLAIRWKMPQATVRQAVTPAAIAPLVFYDAAPAQVQAASRQAIAVATNRGNRIARIDRMRAGIGVYFLVAIALLLRFCFGLLMSLRLLDRSRRTGRAAEGIEIRESDRVMGPVTLGIVHPVIVLPSDWQGWDNAKLAAVLAHELSHIRRHDSAIQALSMIHRALLWHSPLSWLLHKRVVRLAEEASDDAAIAATHDRALYAQVLLGFMRRAVPEARLAGIPMARYNSPVHRVHRILDSTALSHGINRWSMAAIMALAAPLALAAALGKPTYAAQEKTVDGRAGQTMPTTLAGSPEPAMPTEQTQAAQALTAAPQSPAAPAPSDQKFAAFSLKLADPANIPAETGIRIEDEYGNPVCPLSNNERLRYDPGRIQGRYITLRRLVLDAYTLQQYQLVGGPDWLDDGACFIVEGTSDGPADYATMMGMLRNALADRFGLKLRLGETTMNVRELRIAPGGIKFKPLQPGDAPPPVTQKEGNNTKYGFATIGRLVERISQSGLLATYSATRQSSGTEEPAVDATGLSGQFYIVVDHIQSYDFPFTEPMLSEELKDQLGLELVEERRPQPVYTVVAAHMPDVNQ